MEPIFSRILDDAERVNPQVFNVQCERQNDGLSEGLGQRREIDAAPELLAIPNKKLDRLQRTPAMAQSCVWTVHMVLFRVDHSDKIRWPLGLGGADVD